MNRIVVERNSRDYRIYRTASLKKTFQKFSKNEPKSSIPDMINIEFAYTVIEASTTDGWSDDTHTIYVFKRAAAQWSEIEPRLFELIAVWADLQPGYEVIEWLEDDLGEIYNPNEDKSEDTQVVSS